MRSTNNVQSKLDRKILRTLEQDGRISWIDLAEKLNLSASACQRRVQALQDKGIIKHFSAVIDREQLGLGVKGFVQVKVDRQHLELANDFRSAMRRTPEVEMCHMLTGEVDFILQVVAPNLRSYGELIEKKILALPGVRDASSSIVLETIKRTTACIP